MRVPNLTDRSYSPANSRDWVLLDLVTSLLVANDFSMKNSTLYIRERI